MRQAGQMREQATVSRDHLSGDEGGSVRGQEADELGDFMWFADETGKVVSGKNIDDRLGQPDLEPRGTDQTGAIALHRTP
ncbi:hypothetical protein I551_8562 [Mycobacterium ulcerans str. Harvey]|uniref:Uncharacterized protein n=1 Tax=Mycobacterium ulcerans str. Harvey TaxID=1299332 RepID=A0ABN0RB79_MYCUL|nr:hypothetical protein I551_8562 [Mycobacterium ulcerans str. Harvey]